MDQTRQPATKPGRARTNPVTALFNPHENRSRPDKSGYPLLKVAFTLKQQRVPAVEGCVRESARDRKLSALEADVCGAEGVDGVLRSEDLHLRGGAATEAEQ